MSESCIFGSLLVCFTSSAKSSSLAQHTPFREHSLTLASPTRETDLCLRMSSGEVMEARVENRKRRPKEREEEKERQEQERPGKLKHEAEEAEEEAAMPLNSKKKKKKKKKKKN